MKFVCLLFVFVVVLVVLVFVEFDFVVVICVDYEMLGVVLFDWFYCNFELFYKEVNIVVCMVKELCVIFGIVVIEKVGGIGVVGVMSNGVGVIVLVCVDMDGFLVEEKIGLVYVLKVY